MKIKNLNSSKGFTVVELMIAMSVLATILVICTVIMIQIGRSYTKGVNVATLQNTARNVNADLNANLEFGGFSPNCTTVTATTCYASKLDPLPIYSFCIGATRYSYILNRELGTDSDGTVTRHVLWRDTLKDPSSCPYISNLDTAADPGTDPNADPAKPGYEMVPEHVRITRFKVTNASSGFYTIDISMAYGDKDLVTTDANGSNTCNGGSGTEYCAISNLSTTVKRRVE